MNHFRITVDDAEHGGEQDRGSNAAVARAGESRTARMPGRLWPDRGAYQSGPPTIISDVRLKRKIGPI